jgi:hypothetical protein
MEGDDENGNESQWTCTRSFESVRWEDKHIILSKVPAYQVYLKACAEAVDWLSRKCKRHYSWPVHSHTHCRGAGCTQTGLCRTVPTTTRVQRQSSAFNLCVFSPHGTARFHLVLLCSSPLRARLFRQQQKESLRHGSTPEIVWLSPKWLPLFGCCFPSPMRYRGQ